MSFFLPLEVAAQSGRLHLVNPRELQTVEHWAMWLEALLHNPCSIHEHDGDTILIETKQLVERLDGLCIEIYSGEHPPPHFHVKSPEVDASFAIDDCRVLNGKARSSAIKKIKYWHRSSKDMLIEVWNSTRPTSCTVGEYRDA